MDDTFIILSVKWNWFWFSVAVMMNRHKCKYVAIFLPQKNLENENIMIRLYFQALLNLYNTNIRICLFVCWRYQTIIRNKTTQATLAVVTKTNFWALVKRLCPRCYVQFSWMPISLRFQGETLVRYQEAKLAIMALSLLLQLLKNSKQYIVLYQCSGCGVHLRWVRNWEMICSPPKSCLDVLLTFIYPKEFILKQQVLCHCFSQFQ